MPIKPTTAYQNILTSLLQEKMPHLTIKKESASFVGYHHHYSPRVDIAIGPFSIEPGGNKIAEYNGLIQEIPVRNFLRKLYDLHVENIGDEHLNEINIQDFDQLMMKDLNARCFIVIEIENRNSKKHIMVVLSMLPHPDGLALL